MASTEAVAIISGASAVAGAFIGAAAGHFTTIRSQKLQAGEDHLRHRQGVYHDFLDCAHEFMHSVTVPPAAKDNQEWSSWFRTFEGRLTAVQLFGAKGVRKAALRLKDAIGEVLDEVGSVPGSNIQEKRRTAYLEHEKQVMVAYDETIAAMRA